MEMLLSLVTLCEKKGSGRSAPTPLGHPSQTQKVRAARLARRLQLWV